MYWLLRPGPNERNIDPNLHHSESAVSFLLESRLLPDFDGLLRHVYADGKSDDQVRITPSGRQDRQAGRENTEIRR